MKKNLKRYKHPQQSSKDLCCMSVDIAIRIIDLLTIKNITLQKFSQLMNTSEKEIKQWFCGHFCFTEELLISIEKVLKEPLVKRNQLKSDEQKMHQYARYLYFHEQKEYQMIFEHLFTDLEKH